MKIAIYNRHLGTMGGGEKYNVIIAEYLSKNNDLEIITHDKVDISVLSQRLNLDLSKVKLRYIDPEATSHDISNISREYDYFINSTYMSRVRNYAKNGVLILFFPTILDHHLTLRKSQFTHGVLSLVFNQRKKYRLIKKILKQFRYLVYIPLYPLMILTGKQNSKPIYHLRERLYNSFLRHHHFVVENGYLKTYNYIFSISEYSHYWAKKMLNLDTKILYPPVDVNEFNPGEKENIIISVGRFFVETHNKKQYEMIKAFKKLYYKDPKVRSYEYHLCGGVDNSPINQSYLSLCRREAEGYPIYIHDNIEFNDLKTLYSKAKIFWHAAGLNENVNNNPERFEHFGITTVEAMSAGVVPVVIGLGGQPEIVKNGVNGFLWLNENELVYKTLDLINNNNLQVSLSKSATESTEKFSRESMYNRIDELLGI